MIEIVSTREQLERCWLFAREVFVEEQRVPEEEVDALDTAPETIHLLASRDGRDLGPPGSCPKSRDTAILVVSQSLLRHAVLG